MTRPLLLVLLAGCATARPPAASPGGPNILLVITDDQGYGDLGLHGNDAIRTPRLDRLGRESLRFDQFHVMPVCSPTRACLLTGLYGYRTGVVDTYLGRSLMHADVVTLPERLRDAGYRTGIFGKWHLGDNHPLRAIDQGFDAGLTLKGGGIGQPSDPPGGDSYFDPTLYRDGRPVKTKGYVTDVITDGALEFIRAGRGRPFFAYVAYNCPHTPLQVADADVKPYLDAGLPETTAKVYGMVANIDMNVGRLLDALDALQLARDTIVIFMTDNGPQHERFNAGMRGRKGTVFQGGIRVPFFLRWPARVQPGIENAPAAHVDVAPTLLAAAGIRTDALDGVDLLSPIPERPIFFQWHRGDAPEAGRACAVRRGPWKWIRETPSKDPMLFDLRADPAEKTDVSAAHPDVVRQLSTAYEAWFKDVSGTRGYAPPRILLGAPQENPVLLTRQDMRGPLSGWGPKNLGHWEIEVARAGRYRIRLIFPETTTALRASVQLGTRRLEADVPPGAKEVVFPEAMLEAGPVRLDPRLGIGADALGVHYVEVLSN